MTKSAKSRSNRNQQTFGTIIAATTLILVLLYFGQTAMHIVDSQPLMQAMDYIKQL